MASIEVTFSKTVIHCTALIAYNLLYNFWTLGPALHICLTPELNNNLHTHANFHLKQAASIQQVPFCALFICKMRYRLLAEKLQTSALIQGLPVLQLTLQLGPCIQIYIHQVVECIQKKTEPCKFVLKYVEVKSPYSSNSLTRPLIHSRTQEKQRRDTPAQCQDLVSLYFCTSKCKIDKAYQTSQENQPTHKHEKPWFY